MTDLTFRVKNLGVIQRGRFTQKPLTIFCGPNNSGKTWAMYSLYGCYNLMDFSDDEEFIPHDLTALNDIISVTLWDLFNASLEQFADTVFEVVDDDAWQHFTHSQDAIPNVFLLPAERSGLHLFFRELSTRRTSLLHRASREDINLGRLLRDVIQSRYAIPIADYIDWLNDLSDKQKSKSSEFHFYAEHLERHLAGGAYRVDSRTGRIIFKPYQARRDDRGTNAMDLHMTSSTVKSLFGLWFYLEHEARKGNLLMIDEPELNIHPDNQRKIARLLAKLVNAGLNITISTHSDYIVREFNTLIMLSQDKDKKLRKKYEYEDDEILNPEQVGAYLFDNQTIKPFEITPDDGIYATTFDEVIENLNNVNDDIFYSLQEQKDEQEDD